MLGLEIASFDLRGPDQDITRAFEGLSGRFDALLQARKVQRRAAAVPAALVDTVHSHSRRLRAAG